CLLIDIFHRVAITAWASHLGHKPRVVFPLECGHTNAHINDGCIDAHLFSADRTTIEVLLRRRPEGLVYPLRRGRLVFLATHTSLSSSLPVRHRSRRRSGAISATAPCRADNADSARGRAPRSAGTAGGRSAGRSSSSRPWRYPAP